MLMGGAKFYKTLSYPFNPLHKPTVEDIARYAANKLPSLSNRKDVKLILY